MARVVLKNCQKCQKKFTCHGGNVRKTCYECDPAPKVEKWECPGCCICRGGWVPESERRY